MWNWCFSVVLFGFPSNFFQSTHATFFTNFDQIMSKLQITGQTGSNNLKMRMNLLKKDDFERVKSYLERIK